MGRGDKHRALSKTRPRNTEVHHSIPGSRFKRKFEADNKDNLVIWDSKFHLAWHRCFGNLTPEEVIIFIEIIQKGVWTKRDLHALREQIKEKTNADDVPDSD